MFRQAFEGGMRGRVGDDDPRRKLDDLILNALTRRLLTPKWTQSIVAAVAKKRADGKSDASQVLNQLRGQLGQVNKRIRNLLGALADGIAGDTELSREKMAGAENERAELV